MSINMIDNPLFSIVTVCYNSSETIARTINSILVQKCKDYEYIIVDGASKDQTVNIIKCYEPQFEGRMRWISEPDKGIYDAFNKGCKMAQGKYVWIVNSDDFIQPDALEELSKVIAKLPDEKLPIISGVAHFVSCDGRKIIREQKCSPLGLERAYREDSIGIVHPATLVPKDVYERVGYFDDRYKIIGDQDWFQRAYCSRESFVFIDNVITNMADGGISNLFVYKRSATDRKLLLKKKYKNVVLRTLHFIKWSIQFFKAKYSHTLTRR